MSQLHTTCLRTLTLDNFEASAMKKPPERAANEGVRLGEIAHVERITSARLST